MDMEINITQIITKLIAWASTLGIGGIIAFSFFVRPILRDVWNLLSTLIIIAIIFWVLSSSGRLSGVLPQIVITR